MAKLVIGNTKTNGVPAVIVGSVPNITSLSVTPTTSAQSITATGGVDGYSPVNVSAVDNTIDANITAGNIKSGVTILGVTGTLPTVSEPYLELMVDNGALKHSTTTSRIVDISGATSLNPHVLADAYNNNQNISGTVDFHTLTTVAYDYVLWRTFRNCGGITGINLSGLTSVNGNSAFEEAFNGCTNVTSLNLSSLALINGQYSMQSAFRKLGITTLDLGSLAQIQGSNSCKYMFAECGALTSVDLSGLTTVTGYGACQFMFNKCTSLASVTFTSLSNISNGSVFDNMFSACTGLTTLSFPALTSTSFGTYNNQFANMIAGCTGVTIHFPSNLDPAGGSTVISSKTGYPNFGGSSTTLAFDLTATN